MNSNDLEITFTTSNKSGVLSSIMLLAGKQGLIYRRYQLHSKTDDSSKMVVQFSGALKCSKDELINNMEAHADIFSVDGISIDYSDSNQTSDLLSQDDSLSKSSGSAVAVTLYAQDAITPKALKVAEQALLNVLGPVATVLIKTAASRAGSVGELFSILAKELSGQEKNDFLALISEGKSTAAVASSDSAPAPSKPAVEPAPVLSTASTNLPAHDLITPASLQIAEDKLLEFLGPVAPMLVKSAAAKTKHIGDLYSMLANELEGDERKEFLASVSDLALK